MLQAQSLFQNYDTIYVRFFSYVYLRSFLLCGVFIPKDMTIFLQTRIYMRTKTAHRYGLQTNYEVTAGRRIRGVKIIPSAINHFMYDGAEK